MAKMNANATPSVDHVVTQRPPQGVEAGETSPNIRTPSPAESVEDSIVVAPGAPKKIKVGKLDINPLDQQGKRAVSAPVWRNPFAVTYTLNSPEDAKALQGKVNHVRIANQLDRSVSDPTFIVVPDADDDVFAITHGLATLQIREDKARVTKSEPDKTTKQKEEHAADDTSDTSSTAVSDIASSSVSNSHGSPSSLLTVKLNPKAPNFRPLRVSEHDPYPRTVAYASHKAVLKLAQRIFAGKNVVFVGNLPYEFDNATLTNIVHQKFSIFGQMAGIVRRSVYRKPYAILQFFHHISASAAITHGSTITIAGRRCRVSRSNANKCVCVDGSSANLADLQEIGPCRMVGINRVRFERYGDYLAAYKAGLV